MGDIADMMLDGTLCQLCGVYLDGEGNGCPTYCAGCEKEMYVERKERRKRITRVSTPKDKVVLKEWDHPLDNEEGEG